MIRGETNLISKHLHGSLSKHATTTNLLESAHDWIVVFICGSRNCWQVLASAEARAYTVGLGVAPVGSRGNATGQGVTGRSPLKLTTISHLTDTNLNNENCILFTIYFDAYFVYVAYCFNVRVPRQLWSNMTTCHS